MVTPSLTKTILIVILMHPLVSTARADLWLYSDELVLNPGLEVAVLNWEQSGSGGSLQARSGSYLDYSNCLLE